MKLLAWMTTVEPSRFTAIAQAFDVLLHLLGVPHGH